MNLLQRVASCLLVLGTVLGASAAPTTRLTLTNGATIVGHITKGENGKIYFSADLLGDLVIDSANVSSRSEVAPAVSAAPLSASAAPVVSQASPAGLAEPAPAGPAILGGAAKPGAVNPNKPVWTRMITVGANYTSAAFKQGTVTVGAPLPPGTQAPTGASLGLPGRMLSEQFSASIARVTPQNTFSLDGNFNYVDVQPMGRQVDNYTGTFSYLQHLNPTYYAVSRTSYYHDTVRNIDYSAMQIFGVGRMLLNGPMTKLELVPGIVFLKQREHLTSDGSLHTGYGFLENFTHAFNPYMMFEQRVLFRTIINHSDLTGIDGYLGFKGKLTAHLAFTTGVTYTYDRSLSEARLPKTPLPVFANEDSQTTVTSGFQFEY